MCREGVPAGTAPLRFAKKGWAMRRQMAGLAVVLMMAPVGASAQSQSDVVWPTYDSVELNADPAMACPTLQAEITHVASDIHILRKAQNRVEDILHSAFDMERYAGTRGPSGQLVTAGGVSGKEAYAKARMEIVASLRVAQMRLDHLKSLEPDCKPAPQPAAAP
jgi:hypothetical protein